jgi:hypothetical protein
MPPRELNAFTAASAARASSFKERADDWMGVTIPSGYFGREVLHGPLLARRLLVGAADAGVLVLLAELLLLLLHATTEMRTMTHTHTLIGSFFTIACTPFCWSSAGTIGS